MKEKLLNKLPNKYHCVVQDFVGENGLIDDCKYILVFSEGYTWDGYESLPCKSITEAIKFIKEAKQPS